MAAVTPKWSNPKAREEVVSELVEEKRRNNLCCYSIATSGSLVSLFNSVICCFSAAAAGRRSCYTAVSPPQFSIQYDFWACFVFVSPLGERQASVVVMALWKLRCLRLSHWQLSFSPPIWRRFQLCRAWSLLFFLLFCFVLCW